MDREDEYGDGLIVIIADISFTTDRDAVLTINYLSDYPYPGGTERKFYGSYLDVDDLGADLFLTFRDQISDVVVVNNNWFNYCITVTVWKGGSAHYNLWADFFKQ